MLSHAEIDHIIVDAAKKMRYLYYHTYDSRKSQEGFPDWCLSKSSNIIFAEVKTGRDKLTLKQADWIIALRGSLKHVYVVREDTLDLFLRLLASNCKILCRLYRFGVRYRQGTRKGLRDEECPGNPSGRGYY